MCQCRFQVGGIPRAEIAQFQSAIRCHRGHLAENSPLICRSRPFFWWAESSFLHRECVEQQLGASCSELNAVSPQVCRAALVKLSHRAKLLREVSQQRLGSRLRLLSRHP